MTVQEQELLAGLDPFDILDAEAARLDAHFGALPPDGWDRPSNCAGWSVRDVLGHLAGEERYNHACLDGDLAGFRRELAEAGVDSGGFNEWCVRQRRDRPVEVVLAEWREASARTRRDMRARGADATVVTMAGPYPVGLQTFHYASEYATHADDVAAPVSGEEEPSRTHWRQRFARFVLRERDAPVYVRESEPDGRIHVELDGVTAELAPAEFVAATVGRLDAEHPLDPLLREALRCLA
jgi:uncharacterized protein (TIGR03083 family)